MNKHKRLAINMLAQIFAFIVNVASHFLLTPFIVNYLGEEVYGFVGLANNFTSYINVFTVALNGMLNRYVTIELTKKEYRKASEYFSSVTICNITISLAMLLPSAIFCMNMERFIAVPQAHIADTRLLWLIIFAAYLITLAASSFSVATFAVNRLDLASVRQLQSYAIRALFLLVLFSFFTPYVWYVGIATFASAVFIAWTNIRYKRKLTPELQLRMSLFRWSAVRDLVGLGIWNSLNSLSQVLLSGLDLLIANQFVSSGGMGYLSIAKTVPTQLQAFYAMIGNLFTPNMTVLYGKGDVKGFVSETKFAIKMCGAIGSIPLVGFMVFGHDFYGLWVGSLSADLINLIQVLSVLTVFPLLFSVYLYPLYAVNTITAKLKIPVLVSLIGGIASTVTVLFLLKTTTLGIYAVAGVSSLFVTLRVIIFTPLYAAHSLKVKLYTFFLPLLRGVVSLAVLTGVFYALKQLLPTHSWATLCFAGLVCGLCAVLLNFLIVFNRAEQKSFLAILSRRLLKK